MTEERSDDNDSKAKNGKADPHVAVIKECKKRFKRSQTWEGPFRKLFVDDTKFANADSDNLWQWPDNVRQARQDDERPILTINKTRQHCLNILNDARQNKSAIAVKPVGDEATYESAKVFEGLVRHIEYISNAQSPYQHAMRGAVQGGIGYWRVVTDYIGDDSFDQEIFIRRIKDPMSVYLDPDINEIDGSDARFGIIFDDMAKDAFEQAYPDHKDDVGPNAIDEDDDWISEDHVRVAEYFRAVKEPSQLIAYLDPESGQMAVKRSSDMDRGLYRSVIDIPSTKVRSIFETKIEWYVIAGNEVIEEREWAGRFVPIVRVIGEETVIDGKLDRKGHVRALKDPQRMYNYNASAQVEVGGLQSKIPYIGPMAAFENYTTYWDSANTENHAWLPFNHMDDDGNPIPAPQRQQPPIPAQAYQQGMMNAAEDMRLVSGQYQADMGAPGNERSGKAIQERQRQGDNATYHYIDNQATAIRFTGKIIIDLAPHVYDTKRLKKILGEDGSETEVTIDPDAKRALQQRKTGPDTYEAIFNPSVGRYDVEADIGPAFATRRQEAFNAISQILSQNKDLTMLIGDLLMKNADFPGADEMAERLRRMVPAQASGDGPSPEVEQLKQQLEATMHLLDGATRKLAEKGASEESERLQRVIDAGKLDVSAYEAQSRRLGVLKEALQTDPEGVMALVRKVVDEAIATSVPKPPPEASSLPEPVEPQGPMGGLDGGATAEPEEV